MLWQEVLLNSTKKLPVDELQKSYRMKGARTLTAKIPSPTSLSEVAKLSFKKIYINLRWTYLTEHQKHTLETNGKGNTV